MESGNKLRESSCKKIEELLIEGNHKRSDRGQSRSRSNSSKTNINTNETINDEIYVTQTKRWLPVNSKIEDRLTKIENKIDTLSKEIQEFKSELKTLLSDKINLTSSVKESFIADVVKNDSKLLIKVSIYPTKDECCGAVEGYLVLNHASFFSNFTEDDWISFYNENIHKQMNPKDKNSSIVLVSVIDRVLQNDYSNAEIAYVLVICSTILNPNHDEIMLKKNIMKQKVKKFLKKINNQTDIKYSDFEDNSYEEEESGNETKDNEDDDVMMYNKDW
ncbi:hypothetical protein GLOIN_2v1880888 [Rhizophagus irregularis DAOM 181602=DAOM 197198]|uniref:Uncharacterized protein n=1 Tax=Rhizophagus irregularis (strain DAOM 181602 / DAOM 197198 / MUCL 43194) TaxID=747089 RepID=A0A2P4PI04_RHIID|nr:hypothetical protein GLOIN_2v1880888 [Rhizophagus irregularis DAOM 181602=DAOM 197198]POG65011.1 hypothetical protein GLOIN_2v1880888 [Rhizophagus irregularis DAOM 181602=DAOM 197198]|eukprot:XP_025171877.1 hypothetical protein GLOIN_2v1880888 [Rhizophagus irregularis DAOM 181602=DAOM 197198]